MMVHSALILWIRDGVAVAMIKAINGASGVVSSERLPAFEHVQRMNIDKWHDRHRLGRQEQPEQPWT
jgi:hypothetical protein